MKTIPFLIACFVSFHAYGQDVPIAHPDFQADILETGSFPVASTTNLQQHNQVLELSEEDISVKINADWVGGLDGGYWPIRTKLINRGPDAKITFRAVPHDQYSTSEMDGASVVKTLDARQNVENEVLLLVPLVTTYSYYRLEISRDKKRIDKLDTSWSLGEDTYNVLHDYVVSWAHIAKGPGRLEVITRMGNNHGIGTLVGHIDDSSLPRNWLAYTPIDFILISQEDWEQSLDEQQHRAILDWVRMGGSLIVHKAEDFAESNTERLDKLLTLDKSSASSAKWHFAQSGSAPQQWLRSYQAVERFRSDDEVDLGSRSSSARSAKRNRRFKQIARPPKFENFESGSNASPSQGNYTSYSSNWNSDSYAVRGFYYGQIVGLSDDFFAASDGDLESLDSNVDFRSRSWSGVHGFTSRTGGVDFYDFVMQNIRVIPTYAYIALITLFSLLIGPVNYIYFYVKKRLTMILWTIPLIALLGTLLLITYTTLSSGFSPRTRLRSVTILDQQQQTSVSTTRTAYFPGRAPAGGMTFDAETAVYPIWPIEPHFKRGVVDWTDSQQFSRSWLPARIRSQFVLQNVRNERGRVSFDGSGESAKMINGLEWTIRKAIVCDENGDVFYVENIAPGKSATFEPLTNDIAQLFQKVIEDQKLESPVDYGDLVSYQRDRYAGGPIVEGRSTNYSSCLAEQQLSWIKRTELNKTRMKPNSYIAILAENPDIEVGIKSHYTVDELHILFGFL